MSTHYRGDAFQIVRGASGSRGSPAERPVFVFQCYIDDSGTSGLPVVTMAGFISTMRHWEAVESRLDEAMNGYGVGIFHAKEFHDNKPPFKKWNKIKKRSFAEEIFSIPHGMLLGLSATIRRDHFEDGKRADGGFDNMSAIGVCFSAILTRIATDPQIGPSVKTNGVSFLVETGNKNNSELENFFHKMAGSQAFEGCLRSISFIPKNSCRAIQLADYLAFYSRRLARNHARTDGKLWLPPCPFIETVKRHGPLWMRSGRGFPKTTGKYIDKDLFNLDDLTALTKRPE